MELLNMSNTAAYSVRLSSFVSMSSLQDHHSHCLFVSPILRHLVRSQEPAGDLLYCFLQADSQSWPNYFSLISGLCCSQLKKSSKKKLHCGAFTDSLKSLLFHYLFFFFLSILFCIILLSYKTVSWLTTLNKVLLFVLFKIENNQSEHILLYFQHFFYPRVSQTHVSRFSVMNDAFWRIRAGERKMAVLFSSTGPQDIQLKGVRCRSQSTWPLVVLCCRQKRWSRSFLEVFPYFKQVYIMKWTAMFLHKINMFYID